MHVKGPIKITIEGPEASGKTRIALELQRMLDRYSIPWASFQETEKIVSYNQSVTIIEKTI